MVLHSKGVLTVFHRLMAINLLLVNSMAIKDFVPCFSSSFVGMFICLFFLIIIDYGELNKPFSHFSYCIIHVSVVTLVLRVVITSFISVIPKGHSVTELMAKVREH